VPAPKTKTEIDLEIKVALLGQKQEQLEASLSILDRRLSRVEVAIDGLRGDVAKWAGFLAALSAVSPFLAGMV